MGKKKPEEMAKQRTIFTQGALERGVDETLATYIFDLMEKFAGYGFNKSHSAAYALVSYQTAWLKAHYPAAFMAAVLSSDMDNTDKVVTFIDECRRMKLNVVPPSVNESEYRFTVNDRDDVIYGLGAIKGVGEGAIESMIADRKENGLFRDLFELCRRIDLRKFNRRVMESLIRAGACDCLGANRATLMNQLSEALRLAEQNSRDNAVGQVDLFGLPDDAVTPPTAIDEMAPDWDEEQRLSGEKETLGLYLTGHPIDRYQTELKHFVTGPLADVFNGGTGSTGARGYGRGNEKQVVIAGLVMGIRTRNANRGGRMAFVILDDGSARIEIRIFPETYDKYRELVVNDNVVVVHGGLFYDEFAESMRLNAERLLDMDSARNEYARRLVLALHPDDFGNGLLNNLADALAPYRQGQCPVWVDYTRPGARARISFDQTWRVRPTETLLRHLRQLVGDRVTLEYR